MSKNSLVTVTVTVLILIGTFFLLSKNPNQTQNNNQNQLLITPTINKTMATELKIEDTQIGTGREVKSGDTVVMHYKGTLEDGTKFDSSYDRGQPFETQIGVGQVIKGWDQGVPGMKIGGKRKLTIPSDLAYGSRGAGNVIPPNATLIFEVELVDIK